MNREVIMNYLALLLIVVSSLNATMSPVDEYSLTDECQVEAKTVNVESSNRFSLNNYANGGYVSESEHFVYYSYLGSLSIIDKSEGDTQVIQNLNLSSIYVKDGLLYYIDSKDHYLKTKSLDDLRTETVILEEISDFQVIDEKVYYSSNSKGNSIYSYDLLSKESNRIIDRASTQLYSISSWLYYIEPDDFYSDYDYGVGSAGKLYRYNIRTGLEESVLENDVTNVMYYDDKIYVIDIGNGGEICSSNLDGSEYEILINENCRDLIIYGDDLFYVDYSDLSSIYKVTLLDFEKQLIHTGGRNMNINIANNHIYFFSYATDEDGLKIIKYQE